MNCHNWDRPIEILLIEDNAGDIRLIQEVLREIPSPTHLSVARDGGEARQALWPQGRRADLPPDLIVLDLNIPGTDGLEWLAAVKGDPLLKHIPVAVLTTSTAESHVYEAYTRQASCYIVKPLGLDPFIDAVKGMLSFWVEVATLAPRPIG